MPEAETDPLDAFEERLGYAFRDRTLLRTALTSPSFRADRAADAVPDNQRLEFLGDAVFGLLSAQSLYDRYMAEDEGSLTVRRSLQVNRGALAGLARRIGLGACLRVGRREEANGARDQDRMLADALEAVFGAVWRDGGWDAVWRVYRRLDPGEPVSVPWRGNPKGALQELAQRHAWPDSPAYELIGVSGPDHEPVYTVRVRVAGGREAEGAGRTKRAAETAAAQALLGSLMPPESLG
ncbi:MAG: ribonuclease III [Kiritimatiellia bacterium]|nr:ribonuclease III [Kiritimatiellia bacterium]